MRKLNRLVLSLGVLFLGACTGDKPGHGRMASGSESPREAAAKALLQSKGCVACHSVNGNPGVGPTFLGLYGKERPLADGSTVVADETYLRESIQKPAAKIVRPYPAAMPVVPLTEAELTTVVEFLKQLK